MEIKFLISTEGNFGDGVNISGSVSRRDDVSVFNSATSLGIIFQDSSAGTISGKSQPILNRQTGLFTQGLDLQIVGSGIRIIVDGLPPGVVLYNRTGIDAEGRPYIQVNSSISGLVSVVLEYHVPNGAPINPTFTLAPFGIIDQPNLSGRIPIGVDKIVPLASGVMIEFTTQQGKHYIIQFSEDMVSWITSGQAILAGGNRVQWIDQGPPKTPSSPVGGSRFYRVIQQD